MSGPAMQPSQPGQQPPMQGGQPMYQGGQPMYQGAPTQTAPPAPTKKPLWKRWWFIVLAIIIFIGVVNSLTGGTNEATPQPAATTQAEQTAAAEEVSATPDAAATEEAPVVEEEPIVEEEPVASGAVAVGEIATSGDMAIVVSGVEPGVKELGNEFLSTEAQGQFIVMTVEVTNNGNEATYFTSGNLKLVSDGKKYEADPTAAIYMDSANSIFESINPGNTLKGRVAFDVPDGFQPEVLEFSGGLFKDPAVVTLN